MYNQLTRTRWTLWNVNYCVSRGTSVFTVVFSLDGLRLQFQLLQPCKIISENKACRRTAKQTNTMSILSVHYTQSFYLKKKRKQNTIQDEQAKAQVTHALSPCTANKCRRLRCQNSRGLRASLWPRFAHSPRTALGLAYYQSWQTCLKVAGNIGKRFGKDNNMTPHNPGNTEEVCYSCTYDSVLQEYPIYGARYPGAHSNHLI